MASWICSYSQPILFKKCILLLPFKLVKTMQKTPLFEVGEGNAEHSLIWSWQRKCRILPPQLNLVKKPQNTSLPLWIWWRKCRTLPLVLKSEWPCIKLFPLYLQNVDDLNAAIYPAVAGTEYMVVAYLSMCLFTTKLTSVPELFATLLQCWNRASSTMAGSSVVAGTLGNIWRGYTRLLEKYPWRTQAANTCLLMGTGDFIAQAAIERRKAINYDRLRTMRFLGVGFVVFGPGMHLWYSSLDKFIKGSRNSVVLRKVFMDQGLFLPFYLATFIALMGALRRENVPEIKHKLHRDYKPMLLASYSLWPAVQLINFYLIPNSHRVLVINFVGLLWNTYIAWKSEQIDEQIDN